jgi:hypothetical protein
VHSAAASLSCCCLLLLAAAAAAACCCCCLLLLAAAAAACLLPLRCFMLGIIHIDTRDGTVSLRMPQWILATISFKGITQGHRNVPCAPPPPPPPPIQLTFTRSHQLLDMAYAPRPSDCEHVLHVLIACANPQHQLHKAALTELNQCRSVPTFAPCAAAVFAGADRASQAAENIRELAGIELKNAMKVAFAHFPSFLSVLPSIPSSLSTCSRLNGGNVFPLKLHTTFRRQQRRCCRALSTHCDALLPASYAGENLLLAPIILNRNSVSNSHSHSRICSQPCVA